ncbi:MAG: hypothetical protein A2Y10_10525 [Planctomycetes bacterium GWF2_41_51]|nr:MAG: hypothetical protein A2Y10_10525 [Planctomycetes bacterium GWF2_41_51]HBG26910.1 hypothetical protein [Phycisphaerales bacterium]
MSYLGIDIGMTGAKALLVAEDGNILERKYTDYGSDYKKNLQKDINPIGIWNEVKDIIQTCRCNQAKDPVKTISFSVSGDDFFSADHQGRPLVNVISAYQNTGIEYENYIIEKFGNEDNIFQTTGQPIRGNVYPLHRILWIKEHLPKIYQKTWKFMCWEDYFNYLLTGKCISDHSLVSRTLLFDINTKQWSNSLMESLDIDPQKFPDIIEPGKIIGIIKNEMAQELSLPVDCQVVTGGFDQPAACLGAGVINSSVFSLSLGTVVASHWLLEVEHNKKEKSYSYCCSLLKNKHMGMFFTFNGCAVLNWFFNELVKNENRTYDYYNNQISSDRPSKLFVMPHFGGAMQPYNDSHSKGMILGLNFDTKREDILKAIYEGIAFDLKRNYRLLERKNAGIKEIRVVGGGSRSDVWMQLLANITGLTITTLRSDEGSSMGVAMLGACAVGAFNSVEEAVAKWIVKKAAFEPEINAMKAFEAKYQKYLQIYDNVKSFNDFLEAQK